MKLTALLLAAAAAALPNSLEPAFAGECDPTETQSLHQPGALPGDIFGRGLAVDGGAAVVGSPGGDGLEIPTVPAVGILTMFHRDSTGAWIADGLFANPRNATYESFGERVAISGDFAVTNARPRTDLPEPHRFGAVYVFGFNGNAWAIADSIIPADTTVVNYFGEDFGIGGDKLAIWNDGALGTGNDEVHMYRQVGGAWIVEAILLNPDGDNQDKFGSSMAIDRDGEVLVVGSSEFGPGLIPGRGAIHIYRHDGTQWNFEQRVDSPNPFGGNRYGLRVAIDGNTIAVASPYTHVSGANNEGAVYVVEWNGSQWMNVARLTASDGAPQDQLALLGADVDGDVVIAGSPSHGTNPTDAGAAYVFRKPAGGWTDATEDAKLVPSVPGQFGYFGYGVGLGDGVALVGEPGNDEQLVDGGQVSVFRLECEGTTAAPPVGPATGGELRVWPNPVRAGSVVRFAAPVGPMSHVVVRDVRGAHVRSFTGTEWDGRGHAGALLPAGTYFLEVRTDDVRKMARVTLVR